MAEELQGKDALVSCLGGSGSFLNRKPVSIYTNSAEVFAAAMRRSGVSRLIIFSAWHMAGNRKTDLLMRMRDGIVFFLFLNKSYVVGDQKNRLNYFKQVQNVLVNKIF